MERPDNRSYRLRGARATGAQEQAYASLWSRYGLALTGEINLTSILPGFERIIMEIGTGMGEATAQIVAEDPRTGFIGVEVHKPGLGALMNLASKNGSENLRLIEEDAHMVLSHHIQDHSLDAIHLYFPDPWPKRKHWKRRIVQPQFLDLVASKVKIGGYIHIATDWVPYAEWINREFAADQRFSGGKIARPDFRPISKFEGQGLRKGHEVNDFRYFIN